VKQIGVESCHALTVKALADSPEKRSLVLSGIDNFVQTHGCAPDRNKVRELVSSVAPETRRAPKELLEVVEIQRLREQTRSMAKRISELERETKRLQKENASLVARVARDGTKRAKRSAHAAPKKSNPTRSSSSSRRT
jgi:hypothetical protein